MRWAILRTYLRLKARQLLSAGKGSAVHDIVGLEVRTPSLKSAQVLFKEIFCDLTYLFRPRRRDPLILDCGSNLGMSILFFKTVLPEARIIGFEPDEVAFELLEANVAANGLRDVELHRLALGAEDGEIEFFVDAEEAASVRSSIHSSRSRGQAVRVEQARLSRFVGSDVDLLKLDVEGAEDGVLLDLIETGAIARIDQMMIEYHLHIDPDREGLGSFLSMLEQSGFGYQVDAYLPARVIHERGREMQDVQVYAYRKREP